MPKQFSRCIQKISCGGREKKRKESTISIVELSVIRIMYVVLVYVLLSNQWYVGYGSYGIEYCIWKEILALAVFELFTYVYSRLKYENVFINAVVEVLYIIYLIPMNASFAINNLPVAFFVETHSYIGVLLLLLYVMSLKFTRNDLLAENKERGDIPKSVDVFCTSVCVVFIGYKLFYNGLDLSLTISANSVYSVRAGFQDYLDKIAGSAVSYFLSILRNLASVVAPFYLMVSLSRKKTISVAISVGCILSIFSVTAGKGKLFMVAIVLVVFVLWKINALRFFNRIARIGVIVLFFVCAIETVLRGESSIFTILVRRTMYIPAWLNGIYYDYFCAHDKVWWSQDAFLLQNLIKSGYKVSPLALISEVYFHGAVSSPNTGMFADAYMNCGAVGILLYPLLLGAFIGFSERVYKRFGAGISVMMAISLGLHILDVPLLRTDTVLSFMLFPIIIWVLCEGVKEVTACMKRWIK